MAICTAQWIVYCSDAQMQDPERVVRMKLCVLVLALLAPAASAFLVPERRVAEDVSSGRALELQQTENHKTGIT